MTQPTSAKIRKYARRIYEYYKNIRKFRIGSEVELNNFFSTRFMVEYTLFETFDEFAGESPWTIEIGSDLKSIDEDKLDQYVRNVTKFSSWQSMVDRSLDQKLPVIFPG